jgi:hypothetical protein
MEGQKVQIETGPKNLELRLDNYPIACGIADIMTDISNQSRKYFYDRKLRAQKYKQQQPTLQHFAYSAMVVIRFKRVCSCY